jgi:hypothetical protein
MSNNVPTGRPALIRSSPLERVGLASLGLLKVLPAGLVSVVAHGGIVVLFLLVTWDNKADAKGGQEQIIQSQVEPPPKEDDLSQDDLGLDPQLPTNYDVERKADVSVPGLPDPTAPIGIAGGEPEAPQVTLPPPPGSGGGQGGGVEVPGVVGTGSLRDQLGGYAGGINVPGGFAGRSGATRERLLQVGGGNERSEQAVAIGLLWLARHQAPDGHWALDNFQAYARDKFGAGARYYRSTADGSGMKNDIAGTAFGVLPFLASGQTHKSTGKKSAKDYTKTVESALNYLCAKQGRDGDFGGGMYAHGLATIAVCEAYGLTSDPRLKTHAQRAIDFIVRAQDPASGGWRYTPRAGGDTSVVGWQVMALKSGQMSGLNIPTATLRGATKWLDSCETSDKGGFGYIGPADSPTTSAVGLLCREYLGAPPRHPSLINGVKKLQRYLPAPSPNIYYEYYATQVMHHVGGDAWDLWNKGPGGKNGMRDILVARQQNDQSKNDTYGSWGPAGDPHGTQGGRIMQTSLSLLTLEVYYRHLPLYRREMQNMK